MPNIHLASYRLRNTDWAIQDREVTLSVSLLNKGNTEAHGITTRLLPLKNTTKVKQGSINSAVLAVSEIQELENTFVFSVESEEDISVAQFKLVTTDQAGNEWVDFFEIPIRAALPEIENFEIADGRQLMVASAGDETKKLPF